MKRTWIPILLGAMLCGVPVIATAQDELSTTASAYASMGMPAKVVTWTNKLGYATTDLISLYASVDAMGDPGTYTLFVYRENIETGERMYLSPGATAAAAMSETPRDYYGNAAGSYSVVALPELEQYRLWRGSISSPGLWHFVMEVRSPDTTQVIKRAFAKFVVSTRQPNPLGADGTDTEISVDTTWDNDTIWRIQHQVFVNAGATLTIEPGTLILARGQNAVIVIEKGAKIMAMGRKEAPIVMTCDQDLGLRESGCWGGLILLGNAPMTRGEGRAEGVLPETRPVYGGNDEADSSGELHYVRVEFAGVDFNPETQPNAFGFHGIGSGTVIDHIQAHEGEDDGIEFFGGTADCRYCVASGAKDDSLDWAFGWSGTAQYVYIQQDPQSDNGIEADNDSSGFDRTPRSSPNLYNVTMLGGLVADSLSAHSGDGMRLRRGTAVTARNVILTGFGGDALDVRDNSPALFTSGDSSVQASIIIGNGGQTEWAQLNGLGADTIGTTFAEPMLVNTRYEGNPDPRPMAGSPALAVGSAATPPSNELMLDTSAQFVGAFGDENWLEEWTFFGDELDYDVVE